MQGYRQGFAVRRGHGQQGGVPGFLDLREAGDFRQEFPVGQIVGRVRQTLPGEDEILGLDSRPVRPDGVLPEGKGIGGVARVVGFQRVVLRLPLGQDCPAVSAVLPAQKVLVEVVENGLAAPGGDGGGVQSGLGLAGADGQDVRLEGDALIGGFSILRRLAAGAQQQGQQGPQQGSVFLSHKWPHCFSVYLLSDGTSLPSPSKATGWIWLRVCLAMSLSRTMLG